jgi:preprotein translocase subunit SecE
LDYPEVAKEVMNKVVGFIREVLDELGKVTWPVRDELIGSTIIVCILVIVCAAILGFMDGAFGTLIKKFVL